VVAEPPRETVYNPNVNNALRNVNVHNMARVRGPQGKLYQVKGRVAPPMFGQAPLQPGGAAAAAARPGSAAGQRTPLVQDADELVGPVAQAMHMRPRPLSARGGGGSAAAAAAAAAAQRGDDAEGDIEGDIGAVRDLPDEVVPESVAMRPVQARAPGSAESAAMKLAMERAKQAALEAEERRKREEEARELAAAEARAKAEERAREVAEEERAEEERRVAAELLAAQAASEAQTRAEAERKRREAEAVALKARAAEKAEAAAREAEAARRRRIEEAERAATEAREAQAEEEARRRQAAEDERVRLEEAAKLAKSVVLGPVVTPPTVAAELMAEVDVVRKSLRSSGGVRTVLVKTSRANSLESSSGGLEDTKENTAGSAIGGVEDENKENAATGTDEAPTLGRPLTPMRAVEDQAERPEFVATVRGGFPQAPSSSLKPAAPGDSDDDDDSDEDDPQTETTASWRVVELDEESPRSKEEEEADADGSLGRSRLFAATRKALGDSVLVEELYELEEDESAASGDEDQVDGVASKAGTLRSTDDAASPQSTAAEPLSFTMRDLEEMDSLLARCKELKKTQEQCSVDVVEQLGKSMFDELYAILKKLSESMDAGDEDEGDGAVDAIFEKIGFEKADAVTKMYHLLYLEDEVTATQEKVEEMLRQKGLGSGLGGA